MAKNSADVGGKTKDGGITPVATPTVATITTHEDEFPTGWDGQAFQGNQQWKLTAVDEVSAQLNQ